MLQTVETQAWDGAWYTRAYDAAGNPVGSQSCKEGKIFIESQGWCILGGAGLDNGRAKQALESVHQHLFTKNGIVLQQPAYSDYHLELGEVTSYPPGYKENAGIFSHNNTWIHIALTMLGDGNRAYEYYLSINPANKESQIDTYRSEPYVYAQMTAGKDAATFGEAKNSWLTGTAAWSYVVITQSILGMKPDFTGLRIDPCIPSSWPSFNTERRYRDTHYSITIKNPSRVCSGVKSVVVDGRPIEGNLLPMAPGKHLKVEVTLG
jgi:cellobiose phosphorylase